MEYTFGESLQLRRLAKGLSVRGAARRLGVSPTTVQNLEGGKTLDPRASMLVKLCRFYELELAGMANKCAKSVDNNK
jgi:transcriptional regulator with XRE-family HTH domain